LKALRKGNDQVAKLKPFVTLEDRKFRLTKLLDQDLLGSTISGPGLPAHPFLSTLKGVEKPILRLHPLGCGIMQHNLFLDWHKYGLQLEWLTQCIRPMIYLYAATRLLDNTAPVWPDMELLIYRQDPQRLFYGTTRPKEYSDCCKFLKWSSGISITHGSGTRLLNPKELYNPDRARNIVDPSMLIDNLGWRCDMPAESNHEIDSAVAKWAATARKEDTIKQLLRQLNYDATDLEPTLSDLKKQALNNKPHDIMKRLSTWLEADAIDFNFDWFSMHNTCALLWKHIYDVLNKNRGFLTFDPNEFRATHFPRVSFAAQILDEARDAYTGLNSYDLTRGEQNARHALRVVKGLIQKHIFKPGPKASKGKIWVGDTSVASTLEMSQYKGVRYPGIAFRNSGPVRLSELYANWTAKDQNQSRVQMLVDEAMKKEAPTTQVGTARFRDQPDP
jgi:hypothetical protein